MAVSGDSVMSGSNSGCGRKVASSSPTNERGPRGQRGADFGEGYAMPAINRSRDWADWPLARAFVPVSLPVPHVEEDIPHPMARLVLLRELPVHRPAESLARTDRCAGPPAGTILARPD